MEKQAVQAPPENMENTDNTENPENTENTEQAKKKPKPKPPKYKIKAWYGNDRIKLNGKWYILISNLQSDTWHATPETEGEYKTRYGVLETVTLSVPNEELQKARNLRGGEYEIRL